MNVIKRHVIGQVEEMLEFSPVVIIEGARQVGKSTLTKMVAGADTRFTTMDDDLTRGFAHDDPVGFLRSAGERRLVIDEIQRCPELILPIKAEVDRDRQPGRFLLTGSANLFRIPGAEDSLAGRALTMRLYPFSQGELVGSPDDWVTAIVQHPWQAVAATPRAELVEKVVAGGYPPIQDLNPRLQKSWLKDYSQRLIERDSTDLGTTQIPLLQRLFQLLAAAPGAELVTERLADSLGISRGTVMRYLDILEGLFLIHRVPGWSRNLTSRQTMRTKCYLGDSGLAAVIAGLTAHHLQQPHGSDHFGALLENFVLTELLKQQSWSASDYTISYYRDRNGAEVDLIIETPQGVIACEIKANNSPRMDNFRHIVKLREKLGTEFLAGIVLSLAESQQAGDRLYNLPISSLWTY